MVRKTGVKVMRRWSLAALGVAAAACIVPPLALAQQNLEALIKAAKAEGEVVYYLTEADSVGKRFSEAFSKKYGIKSAFVRLNSPVLQQRFATEAESGNIAADVLFNAANSAQYAADGIKKGWIESIAEAGLPVILSGEYPAALRGQSALVKVSPSYIVYNTDKVKGADIPKDWPDLLNPKFKGQVLLPDPASSDANLAFWYLVMNTFGESYLQKLSAQAGRRFDGGVPTIQSLAAGEGMVMVPIAYAQVTALKQKGAPIDGVAPITSTGVETSVMLTARSKAKHPNAARLLVNYVLSREGNAVLQGGEIGGFSIYELDKLPKNFKAPPQGAGPHREKIRKLLGF